RVALRQELLLRKLLGRDLQITVRPQRRNLTKLKSPGRGQTVEALGGQRRLIVVELDRELALGSFNHKLTTSGPGYGLELRRLEVRDLVAGTDARPRRLRRQVHVQRPDLALNRRPELRLQADG